MPISFPIFSPDVSPMHDEPVLGNCYVCRVHGHFIGYFAGADNAYAVLSAYVRSLSGWPENGTIEAKLAYLEKAIEIRKAWLPGFFIP